MQCTGIVVRTGQRCRKFTNNSNGTCYKHPTAASVAGAPKSINPPNPNDIGRDPPALDPCCVCSSDPTPELLNCDHPLCLSCVTSLRTPSCPLCRSPLVPTQVLTKSVIDTITTRQDDDRKAREAASVAAFDRENAMIPITEANYAVLSRLQVPDMRSQLARTDQGTFVTRRFVQFIRDLIAQEVL